MSIFIFILVFRVWGTMPRWQRRMDVLCYVMPLSTLVGHLLFPWLLT